MDPEAILEFGKASGVHGFMHSDWGWPIVESLHFIGLTVLLGTIGLFDLRVLGVAKAAPISPLERLVPFGVAAFALNVVTGAMFFVSAPDQYLYNPAFQLKGLLILIAGLNVAALYLVARRGLVGVGPGCEASAAAKAMALVSLCAWIGVIAFGRLITYFRPPYHWCFWC